MGSLHAQSEDDGSLNAFLDSVLPQETTPQPTPKPQPIPRPVSHATHYDETAGLSAAQIRELGVDYAEARNGKRKNEQRAIELYRKAADRGDKKAQRWMGWRYRQGRGVPKNEQMARSYFNMAAAQGDTAAAQALAMGNNNNSSSYNTPSHSGLGNQTARMWAERIWSNYSNNDLSYMWEFYAPQVYLHKQGIWMSRNDLIESQRKYLINRWTYRFCYPIDFAWANNRVEIRFRYTCSNNTGKSVSGYCKNTIFISSDGRIEGFIDNSSTKSLPNFSPGLIPVR